MKSKVGMLYWLKKKQIQKQKISYQRNVKSCEKNTYVR